METHLFVVSPHPLIAIALVRAIAGDNLLRQWLSPKALQDPSTTPQSAEPTLFLIDVNSVRQITTACAFLRMRCPESQLLALVAPQQNSDDEMLALLSTGFDGAVLFTEDWEQELLKAVHAIIDGQLWFPPTTIRKYVRQTNSVHVTRQMTDRTLTGRQAQILELVVRKLSNKEIAEHLSISERTVKFHVSQLLSRLRVPNRTTLLTTFGSGA